MCNLVVLFLFVGAIKKKYHQFFFIFTYNSYLPKNFEVNRDSDHFSSSTILEASFKIFFFPRFES